MLQVDPKSPNVEVVVSPVVPQIDPQAEPHVALAEPHIAPPKRDAGFDTIADFFKSEATFYEKIRDYYYFLDKAITVDSDDDDNSSVKNFFKLRIMSELKALADQADTHINFAVIAKKEICDELHRLLKIKNISENLKTIEDNTDFQQYLLDFSFEWDVFISQVIEELTKKENIESTTQNLTDIATLKRDIVQNFPPQLKEKFIEIVNSEIRKKLEFKFNQETQKLDGEDKKKQIEELINKLNPTIKDLKVKEILELLKQENNNPIILKQYELILRTDEEQSKEKGQRIIKILPSSYTPEEKDEAVNILMAKQNPRKYANFSSFEPLIRNNDFIKNIFVAKNSKIFNTINTVISSTQGNEKFLKFIKWYKVYFQYQQVLKLIEEILQESKFNNKPEIEEFQSILQSPGRKSATYKDWIDKILAFDKSLDKKIRDSLLMNFQELIGTYNEMDREQANNINLSTFSEKRKKSSLSKNKPISLEPVSILLQMLDYCLASSLGKKIANSIGIEKSPAKKEMHEKIIRFSNSILSTHFSPTNGGLNTITEKVEIFLKELNGKHDQDYRHLRYLLESWLEYHNTGKINSNDGRHKFLYNVLLDKILNFTTVNFQTFVINENNNLISKKDKADIYIAWHIMDRVKKIINDNYDKERSKLAEHELSKIEAILDNLNTCKLEELDEKTIITIIREIIAEETIRVGFSISKVYSPRLFRILGEVADFLIEISSDLKISKDDPQKILKLFTNVTLSNQKSDLQALKKDPEGKKDKQSSVLSKTDAQQIDAILPPPSFVPPLTSSVVISDPPPALPILPPVSSYALLIPPSENINNNDNNNVNNNIESQNSILVSNNNILSISERINKIRELAKKVKNFYNTSDNWNKYVDQTIKKYGNEINKTVINQLLREKNDFVKEDIDLLHGTIKLENESKILLEWIEGSLERENKNVNTLKKLIFEVNTFYSSNNKWNQIAEEFSILIKDSISNFKGREYIEQQWDKIPNSKRNLNPSSFKSIEKIIRESKDADNEEITLKDYDKFPSDFKAIYANLLRVYSYYNNTEDSEKLGIKEEEDKINKKTKYHKEISELIQQATKLYCSNPPFTFLTKQLLYRIDVLVTKIRKDSERSRLANSLAILSNHFGGQSQKNKHEGLPDDVLQLNLSETKANAYINIHRITAKWSNFDKELKSQQEKNYDILIGNIYRVLDFYIDDVCGRKSDSEELAFNTQKVAWKQDAIALRSFISIAYDNQASVIDITKKIDEIVALIDKKNSRFGVNYSCFGFGGRLRNTLAKISRDYGGNSWVTNEKLVLNQLLTNDHGTAMERINIHMHKTLIDDNDKAQTEDKQLISKLTQILRVCAWALGMPLGDQIITNDNKNDMENQKNSDFRGISQIIKIARMAMHAFEERRNSKAALDFINSKAKDILGEISQKDKKENLIVNTLAYIVNYSSDDVDTKNKIDSFIYTIPSNWKYTDQINFIFKYALQEAYLPSRKYLNSITGRYNKATRGKEHVTNNIEDKIHLVFNELDTGTPQVQNEYREKINAAGGIATFIKNIMKGNFDSDTFHRGKFGNMRKEHKDFVEQIQYQGLKIASF